jgi:hypothetical protein
MSRVCLLSWAASSGRNRHTFPSDLPALGKLAASVFVKPRTFKVVVAISHRTDLASVTTSS